MAKVSIIIPHHSRFDLLERFLPSVLTQAEMDFEVVIVDNGSEDGSPEKIRTAFPEVRALEMGENVGFARAVNEGIRATDSPYVLLLNNDVAPAPDYLEKFVGALEKRPEFDWAASRTLQGEAPEKIDNCGLFLSIVGIARKRGWDERDSEFEHRQEAIFGASGNGSLFRRSFFHEVGFFDERFFAYGEDIDLALRAHFLGKRCLYVPEAVCRHWESSTWGRNSRRTIYYFQRNMELAYFKVGSVGFHLKHLIPHLIYSMRMVLLWTIRGEGGLVLRTKWDALKMLMGKEPGNDPTSQHRTSKRPPPEYPG